MKKIATYLVALMVFVVAFFAVKFAFAMVFGTLVRTVILAACGILVLGVGATAVLRKR